MFECNFSKTVGMYLSGFDLKMRAIANTNDHDSLFWVKSMPQTENSNHEIGRSWSVVDEIKMNINLGFNAKVGAEGDVYFEYSNTFTVVYHEKSDISDWTVFEMTNPLTSEGHWKFFQQ